MRLLLCLLPLVALIFGTGIVSAQNIVTECDRLTANEQDPDTPVGYFDYVAFDKLDAEKAVATCLKDLKANPNDNARLKLNLGRAYNKLENYGKSFQYTKQAADAKYRYAYHALALHYYYGEGVEKNTSSEEHYLALAAQNNVAVSHFRLGERELAKGLQADLVKAEGHIEFARRRGMDTTLAHAQLNYGKANSILVKQILSIRTDAEPVVISTSLNPLDLRIYKNFLVSARDLFKDYFKQHENNKYRADLERIEQLLSRRITDDEIDNKIKRLLEND